MKTRREVKLDVESYSYNGDLKWLNVNVYCGDITFGIIKGDGRFVRDCLTNHKMWAHV